MHCINGLKNWRWSVIQTNVMQSMYIGGSNEAGTCTMNGKVVGNVGEQRYLGPLKAAGTGGYYG